MLRELKTPDLTEKVAPPPLDKTALAVSI